MLYICSIPFQNTKNFKKYLIQSTKNFKKYLIQISSSKQAKWLWGKDCRSLRCCPCPRVACSLLK